MTTVDRLLVMCTSETTSHNPAIVHPAWTFADSIKAADDWIENHTKRHHQFQTIRFIVFKESQATHVDVSLRMEFRRMPPYED